jgi:hypothetical protein
MSDEQPPKKRRFWRLHLSTAVLLMFVSGIFLWTQRDRMKAYIDQRKANIEVDAIIARAKRGEFQEDDPATHPGSDLADRMFSNGWTMKNLKGQGLSRSDLQYMAEPLISMGRPAVPQLMRWVEDEDITIQYIARYSLKAITNVDGDWEGWVRNSSIRTEVALSIFVALGVLLAVTISNEWLIRRREGRQL